MLCARENEILCLKRWACLPPSLKAPLTNAFIHSLAYSVLRISERLGAQKETVKYHSTGDLGERLSHTALVLKLFLLFSLDWAVTEHPNRRKQPQGQTRPAQPCPAQLRPCTVQKGRFLCAGIIQPHSNTQTVSLPSFPVLKVSSRN